MGKTWKMGNLEHVDAKGIKLLAKDVIAREINNGVLLSFHKMPKTKGAKPRLYEYYFKAKPSVNKILATIDQAGKRKPKK